MRKLPEHVEETEHGVSCRHCGGVVGDDGYSMALGEGEEFEPIEKPETDQQESTEKMRSSAFANAIRHRRGA